MRLLYKHSSMIVYLWQSVQAKYNRRTLVVNWLSGRYPQRRELVRLVHERILEYSVVLQ